MLKYPTFQSIGTTTFPNIHSSEDICNIVLTYNILIVRSLSFHYLFHLFSCLFSKLMIIKPGIKGIQLSIDKFVFFLFIPTIAFMISQVALQLLLLKFASNFSLYFSLHFLIPSLFVDFLTLLYHRN